VKGPWNSTDDLKYLVCIMLGS